jgi:hypothetical protein
MFTTRKLHNAPSVKVAEEARYSGIPGFSVALHECYPSEVNSYNSPIRPVDNLYMFTIDTSTTGIQ